MIAIRILFVTTSLLILVPPTSNGQDRSKKGFLSVLKVGQIVTLKEDAGRYEITVLKNAQLAHKVIEVGADYVVIEDAARVTETRIPVYSIKAIIRLKLPKD